MFRWPIFLHYFVLNHVQVWSGNVISTKYSSLPASDIVKICILPGWYYHNNEIQCNWCTIFIPGLILSQQWGTMQLMYDLYPRVDIVTTMRYNVTDVWSLSPGWYYHNNEVQCNWCMIFIRCPQSTPIQQSPQYTPCGLQMHNRHAQCIH